MLALNSDCRQHQIHVKWCLQHAEKTCNQFCLKVLYESLISPNFVSKPVPSLLSFWSLSRFVSYAKMLHSDSTLCSQLYRKLRWRNKKKAFWCGVRLWADASFTGIGGGFKTTLKGKVTQSSSSFFSSCCCIRDALDSTLAPDTAPSILLQISKTDDDFTCWMHAVQFQYRWMMFSIQNITSWKNWSAPNCTRLFKTSSC